MKEAYERTKLEILGFQTEDVIMTSDELIDPEEPQDRYMVPIR